MNPIQSPPTAQEAQHQIQRLTDVLTGLAPIIQAIVSSGGQLDHGRLVQVEEHLVVAGNLATTLESDPRVLAALPDSAEIVRLFRVVNGALGEVTLALSTIKADESARAVVAGIAERLRLIDANVTSILARYPSVAGQPIAEPAAPTAAALTAPFVENATRLCEQMRSPGWGEAFDGTVAKILTLSTQQAFTIYSQLSTSHRAYLANDHAPVRQALRELLDAVEVALATPISPAAKTALRDAFEAWEMVLNSIYQLTAVWSIAHGGLPEHLRHHLPAWLDTHLPDPADLDWHELLSYFNRFNNTSKPALAESIKSFAKRAGAPSSSADLCLAAAIAALADTKEITGPFLATAGTENSVQAVLGGQAHPLSEREFNLACVNLHLKPNLRLAAENPVFRAILEVDAVNAFADSGSMFLRHQKVETATCVHESIHLLAAKAGSSWSKVFGLVLNEGATEYLTLHVCQQHGIKRKKNIYPTNVELLKDIMQEGGISLTMLADAYFSNNIGPVRDTIVSLGGEAGLAILATSTDRLGKDTYVAWNKQVITWQDHEKFIAGAAKLADSAARTANAALDWLTSKFGKD